MTPQRQDDGLLRAALWTNAIFSLTCGLIAILFTKGVSTLSGLPNSTLLMLQGASLVGFASMIGAVVMRESVSPRMTKLIVALDWLWIVGIALPVVALLDLTGAGTVLMLILAIAVASLAVLQTLGLRRAQMSTPPVAHA